MSPRLNAGTYMQCGGVNRPLQSEDRRRHVKSREQDDRSGNGKGKKKSIKCKFDCRYIKVRPNDEIAQMATCATEGWPRGRQWGEGRKCLCAHCCQSGEGLFFWR